MEEREEAKNQMEDSTSTMENSEVIDEAADFLQDGGCGVGRRMHAEGSGLHRSLKGWTDRIKTNHWSQTLAVLEQMRSCSVQPDTVAYTAAIGVLGKGMQSWPALGLLREMQENQVEPNVITYNTAITACERTGDWATALGLIDQMTQNDLSPNVITYSAAIAACGRGRQPHMAMNVLKDMQEKGCKPNARSYGSAITACDRGGCLWEDALRLLYEMLDNQSITPTSIPFTAAICCCGHAGQTERCMSLLQELEDRNVEPQVATYNSAIVAFGNTGIWEQAFALMDDMVKKSYTPDMITYTSLINACTNGKQPKRAVALYRQMQAHGPQPNEFTYKAVQRACKRNNIPWDHCMELKHLDKRDHCKWDPALPDENVNETMNFSRSSTEASTTATNFSRSSTEASTRTSVSSTCSVSVVSSSGNKNTREDGALPWEQGTEQVAQRNRKSDARAVQSQASGAQRVPSSRLTPPGLAKPKGLEQCPDSGPGGLADGDITFKVSKNSLKQALAILCLGLLCSLQAWVYFADKDL